MGNEFNDVNSYDDYLYVRNQILKRKTIPFSMANKPLAEYIFRHFKKEFTSARLIETPGGSQFICFDERAVKKVKKRINEKIAKLRIEENELLNLLSELL